MKHRSIALTLIAALAVLGGGLATASAQPNTLHYDVKIWNPITLEYPVTGTMDLTEHSDGVIQGYYHPAGLPSFVPITGGLQGDHIWLTIGRMGGWTLDGRLENGRIRGSATHGGRTPYSFVATPAS